MYRSSYRRCGNILGVIYAHHETSPFSVHDVYFSLNEPCRIFHTQPQTIVHLIQHLEPVKPRIPPLHHLRALSSSPSRLCQSRYQSAAANATTLPNVPAMIILPRKLCFFFSPSSSPKILTALFVHT